MSGVNVDRRQDVFVVSFHDRELADDVQISLLADELDEVLASVPDGGRLLLDFQTVERATSLMLGTLVALNRQAGQRRISLRLCRVPSDVMRIIEATNLQQIFEFQDDLAT